MAAELSVTQPVTRSWEWQVFGTNGVPQGKGAMTTSTITYYYGRSDDQAFGGTSEYYLLADVQDRLSVDGGSGDDYITTGNSRNVIVGGQGADYIFSGSGDDYILGGNLWDSADRVSNYFNGYHGGSVQIFYYDSDTIISGGGKDTVFAGGGDDRVNAGDGDDYVSGRTGNDIIYGGYGEDRIYGDEGDDVLYAGTPANLSALQFSAGPFTFNGIDGDSLHPLSVDSTVTGLGELGFDDPSPNLIDGGAGNDLIVGAPGADSLLGGGGDDTMDGGAGADGIDGGAGRDIIGGGSDNDVIFGGSGNDYLDGSTGNDEIHGDDGEDLVIGGTGTDVLYGGADSDVFLFRAGDGPDIIMDFVPGSQADQVALQGTGWAQFSEVQAHLSWYAPGNATLLQIGTDQIFFNVLRPEQLDASDFFFI